jgi:hypothetical protein
MNSAKKFPKTIYDKLNQETDYDCQGSCTCKYLKDRTNFDMNVYQRVEDGTKIKLPILKTDGPSEKSRGWLP